MSTKQLIGGYTKLPMRGRKLERIDDYAMLMYEAVQLEGGMKTSQGSCRIYWPTYDSKGPKTTSQVVPKEYVEDLAGGYKKCKEMKKEQRQKNKRIEKELLAEALKISDIWTKQMVDRYGCSSEETSARIRKVIETGFHFGRLTSRMEVDIFCSTITYPPIHPEVWEIYNITRKDIDEVFVPIEFVDVEEGSEQTVTATEVFLERTSGRDLE